LTGGMYLYSLHVFTVALSPVFIEDKCYI